jgi:23S rRNA pseudouridine2604 synthase
MNAKRLNKFISDSGFCSRREADKLIEQGRVKVNGKIAEAGRQVTAQDKVRIDDELLPMREEAPVFLLFHKPAGISTATDPSIKNNIISALNYPASLLPVGFLDREAEGLMFLSNDTELVRKLTRADQKFEKEYIVTVDKMLTPEFLGKISESGVAMLGGNREKNFVAKEAPNRFRIVLAPGTNHHLKKMCEDLGYKAVHLQRIRLGNFTTAKLPVRTWRALTEAEIEAIKSTLGSRARKESASSRRSAAAIYPETEAVPLAGTRSRYSPEKPTRQGSSGKTASAENQPAKTAAKGPRVGKSKVDRPGPSKNRAPKSSGRRSGSAGSSYKKER